MNSADSTSHGAGRRPGRLGRRYREPQRARVRLSAAAAAAGALMSAAVVALVPVASASGAGTSTASRGTGGGHGPARSQAVAEVIRLALHPMPAGSVRFGCTSGRRLAVHVAMYGLTPGSSHRVALVRPGSRRVAPFSLLDADGGGQAEQTLVSMYGCRAPRSSRLVIMMGTHSGIGRTPIAETGHLGQARFWRGHRLHAVEISSRGAYYGTPRGRAAIAYNPKRQTLTVTVSASGVTPGPHAAHIHLGSCQSQGPVKYMLPDLVANRHGEIKHAVRVFRHITSPIPASGWYLNIHQGNSADILSNGQPTIFFRPLICANIKASTTS
jgi:hypothetical protein